jgi:hypothetical protein
MLLISLWRGYTEMTMKLSLTSRNKLSPHSEDSDNYYKLVVADLDIIIYKYLDILYINTSI